MVFLLFKETFFLTKNEVVLVLNFCSAYSVKDEEEEPHSHYMGTNMPTIENGNERKRYPLAMAFAITIKLQECNNILQADLY